MLPLVLLGLLVAETGRGVDAVPRGIVSYGGRGGSSRGPPKFSITVSRFVGWTGGLVFDLVRVLVRLNLYNFMMFLVDAEKNNKNALF